MLYLEYAHNVKDRNKIVPVNLLPKLIVESRKKGLELYTSVYMYEEEIIEHLKTYKTVKSYRGNYHFDKIIFDIDNHEKRGQAPLPPAIFLKFVKEKIEEMMETWNIDEESVRIWHSGRGFHIVIPDIFGFEPGKRLPEIVKSTLSKYFNEFIDESIYMRTGFIRAGFTINQKVNLYKTPFLWEDFSHYSYEEIISLSDGKITRIDPLPVIEPQHKNKIIVPVEQQAISRKKTDYSNTITCVQKMFETENATRRHQHILRMASVYRREGIPERAIKILMRDWVPRQKESDKMTNYEIDRAVENVFDADYKFGCRDPLMTEYCDQKCIFYNKKNYLTDVSTMEDAEAEYMQFIRSGLYKRRINLKNILQLDHDYFIFPKELVVIQGSVGVNKSALIQNIALELERKVLYLNLEYSKSLAYRRFIQIKHEMTRDQVFDHYAKTEETLMTGELQNISIVDVAPDLYQLRKAILDANAEVVVIDTVHDIDVKCSGDPLIPTVKELRNILQQIPVIVFAIAHISKDSAKKAETTRKGLNMHDNSGSQILPQKADKVIIIEKDIGNIRSVKSAKSRDEKPFKHNYKVDMETFKFIRTF